MTTPNIALKNEVVSAEHQQVDLLLKQAWDKRKGHAEAMLADCEQALAAARQHHYRIGQTMAMRMVGIAYQRLGRYVESSDHLREAASQFERLNDAVGATDCFFSLGVNYHEMANYGAALEYFTKVFKEAKALGRIRQAARVLDRIGRVYAALRQFATAEQQFLECIRQFEKLGDTKGMARAKAHLGWAMQRTQQPEEANALLREALQSAQLADSDDTVDEVELLSIRAWLEQGRHADAEQTLNALNARTMATADAAFRGHLLTANIRLMLATGRQAHAAAHLAQLEMLAKHLQHQQMAATYYELAAEHALASNDHEKAYRLYTQFSQLHRQQVQANAVTVTKLMHDNFRYMAKQKEEELGRLRNTDNNDNLRLLAQKTAEFERKLQAIRDYQRHATHLQQITFPDSDDLRALWPLAFVTPTNPQLVCNSFLWAAEAKESNLMVMVSCLGNETAAGFLTGVLFSLLNEQLVANLNNDLPTFLFNVEENFFKLLQEKKGSRSVEIRFALARILKDTGHVEIFTKGLPAWVLHGGQLYYIAGQGQHAAEIHNMIIEKGSGVFLCSNEFADTETDVFHKLIAELAATPSPAGQESKALERLKGLEPAQLKWGSTPIVAGVWPLGMD